MRNSKKEKRRHERTSTSEKVLLSVVGSFSNQKEFLPASNITGTVIDVSENGLGFLTDVMLEPGMLVRFDGSKGTQVGVVMWTIDMGNKYRVGLKFV